MDVLSSKIKEKVARFGFENYQNLKVSADSYLHIFLFKEYNCILTAVKSPIESIEGDYLISVFSKMENRNIKIPEKYGYVYDNKDRIHVKNEDEFEKLCRDFENYLKCERYKVNKIKTL